MTLNDDDLDFDTPNADNLAPSSTMPGIILSDVEPIKNVVLDMGKVQEVSLRSDKVAKSVVDLEKSNNILGDLVKIRLGIATERRISREGYAAFIGVNGDNVGMPTNYFTEHASTIGYDEASKAMDITIKQRMSIATDTLNKLKTDISELINEVRGEINGEVGIRYDAEILKLNYAVNNFWEDIVDAAHGWKLNQKKTLLDVINTPLDEISINQWSEDESLIGAFNKLMVFTKQLLVLRSLEKLGVQGPIYDLVKDFKPSIASIQVQMVKVVSDNEHNCDFMDDYRNAVDGSIKVLAEMNDINITDIQQLDERLIRLKNEYEKIKCLRHVMNVFVIEALCAFNNFVLVINKELE